MNLKQFIREIGIPEFKSIIGINGSRVIMLTFILFVSLLVLGVANSSSKLLEKKMKEPFIQFIDVEKPMLKSLKFEEIDHDQAQLLIDDPTLSLSPEFSKGTVIRINLRIPNYKEKQPLGMLITEEDLFYEHLKRITKRTFSDNGFGVIVTKGFFEDFGINKNSWRNIAFIEMDINNRFVNIPIAGVVEELRNNCTFAFSKNFLNSYYNYPEIFRKDYYNGRSSYFLPNIKKIPSTIDSSFKLIDLNQRQSFNYYKQGIMVYTQDTNPSIDSSLGAIEVLNLAKNATNVEDGFDIDYFTFHLKELSKIEVFAKKIKTEYGITIEQSKIEEKKNIDFFRNLTNLLYYTLSGFSILSIILFIVNILISHLDKNKRSLGTLKAFGLSNNYITGLYSAITLFLVSASFIIAYVCTEWVGQYATDKFLNLSNSNAEEFMYVNLDLWVLISLMVITPAIIILMRVFNYLYNVTPGDLIYERK